MKGTFDVAARSLKLLAGISNVHPATIVVQILMSISCSNSKVALP